MNKGGGPTSPRHPKGYPSLTHTVPYICITLLTDSQTPCKYIDHCRLPLCNQSCNLMTDYSPAHCLLSKCQQPSNIKTITLSSFCGRHGLLFPWSYGNMSYKLLYRNSMGKGCKHNIIMTNWGMDSLDLVWSGVVACRKAWIAMEVAHQQLIQCKLEVTSYQTFIFLIIWPGSCLLDSDWQPFRDPRWQHCTSGLSRWLGGWARDRSVESPWGCQPQLQAVTKASINTRSKAVSSCLSLIWWSLNTIFV